MRGRHSGTRLALVFYIMATTLEHTETSVARQNLPICVLDDDTSNIEITRSRLHKAGFPVVATTNPQDALDKIRVGGCRAVLADFRRHVSFMEQDRVLSDDIASANVFLKEQLSRWSKEFDLV